MKLDLCQDGRFVIQNVTDAAWRYIQEHADCCEYTACFSWKDCDGAVFISNAYDRDRDYIMKRIAVLERDYGLTVTKAARKVLNLWKEIEWLQAREEEASDRAKRLKEACWSYFHHKKEGCGICSYARLVMDGDVDVGFCTHAKEELKFGGKVLTGKIRNGIAKVTGFASTWFPCENCYYESEIKKTMEEII